VDNVSPISRHAGRPVQQAYLGACTGGRLEDLAVAARILKGKHIARDTRLIVVPASKQVLLDAMETGVMQTLIASGAAIVTPGCAACLGVHEGMLASGETCITASSRNFPGRMGSGEADIFLGSPAAVAAAALTGALADPRPYFE
jgi:3-isopropylmalate/(R)-2-methylmalate dehydratase large subunit